MKSLSDANSESYNMDTIELFVHNKTTHIDESTRKLRKVLLMNHEMRYQILRNGEYLTVLENLNRSLEILDETIGGDLNANIKETVDNIVESFRILKTLSKI